MKNDINSHKLFNLLYDTCKSCFVKSTNDNSTRKRIKMIDVIKIIDLLATKDYETRNWIYHDEVISVIVNIIQKTFEDNSYSGFIVILDSSQLDQSQESKIWQSLCYENPVILSKGAKEFVNNWIRLPHSADFAPMWWIPTGDAWTFAKTSVHLRNLYFSRIYDTLYGMGFKHLMPKKSVISNHIHNTMSSYGFEEHIRETGDYDEVDEKFIIVDGGPLISTHGNVIAFDGTKRAFRIDYSIHANGDIDERKIIINNKVIGRSDYLINYYISKFKAFDFVLEHVSNTTIFSILLNSKDRRSETRNALINKIYIQIKKYVWFPDELKSSHHVFININDLYQSVTHNNHVLSLERYCLSILLLGSPWNMSIETDNYNSVLNCDINILKRSDVKKIRVEYSNSTYIEDISTLRDVNIRFVRIDSDIMAQEFDLPKEDSEMLSRNCMYAFLLHLNVHNMNLQLESEIMDVDMEDGSVTGESIPLVCFPCYQMDLDKSVWGYKYVEIDDNIVLRAIESATPRQIPDYFKHPFFAHSSDKEEGRNNTVYDILEHMKKDYSRVIIMTDDLSQNNRFVI